MRTLATVKETGFPTQSTKEKASHQETAKDSDSGWEWGKG
jgi:hypothetical protein